MMKAAMLTMTAGALLLAGGAGDEAAQKKERARLTGTWNITKLTTGKGDQDVSGGATLTFGKDGSIEFKKGDETKKATYKLKPAAKPKEIDVSPEDDANKTFLGIYEMKKGTLKLCVDLGQDSQRPTEFTAPDGGSRILLIMEKAK
jgi:uncharacterized protein (TIGR03067 family)